MPDMPTFPVTQAQADRITAAGITPAMAREMYRRVIVAEVLKVEGEKLDTAYNVSRDQQLTAIQESLPKGPTPPAPSAKAAERPEDVPTPPVLGGLPDIPKQKEES